MFRPIAYSQERKELLPEYRGFFDDQAEEGLLRQLLGEKDAADIAVQEEDQPVLVFSDDLGDPVVVTVKETAVAAGSVIH